MLGIAVSRLLSFKIGSFSFGALAQSGTIAEPPVFMSEKVTCVKRAVRVNRIQSFGKCLRSPPSKAFQAAQRLSLRREKMRSP